MNVKIERLNSQFEKEISMILQTEVKDSDIQFVTVTGCEITSDLSFCKVYFTVLEDKNREKILEALNKASSFIRGQLSQRIEIRHTPELKFIYDESIEYGNHIEKLIQEVHKKEELEDKN
ncbi:MAG: 30S ribosome-binding factor RbfA [Bacilli bacterium]|nr:30S ribosome-binding factor RbfA [Bacilli bacterium]